MRAFQGMGQLRTCFAKPPEIRSKINDLLPLSVTKAWYPEWTRAEIEENMVNVFTKASDLNILRSKSSLAFVPTMGALHAGHGALIAKAAELADSVVVSIFVNPLQFENKSDLNAYPITLDADRALAEKYGATDLFIPSYEEVYPEEIKKISSGEIGRILEGHSRPGHFDGVLTVVSRLFELVRPGIAIFGEKDFQQLFLIKKLVERYNFDPQIKIIAHETIRDSYGLALSSRNRRLTPLGKEQARIISKALSKASHSLTPRATLHEELESGDGFTLDYAEIIDESDFSILSDEQITELNLARKMRALVAGWVEGVRLLDNKALINSQIKSAEMVS